MSEKQEEKDCQEISGKAAPAQSLGALAQKLAATVNDGKNRRTVPLINEVALAGRLIQPPEIKDFGEDKLRARLILGVPRPAREREPKTIPAMDFIAVTAWRTMAQQCATLAKGDAVQIQGRLKTWTDKNNARRSDVEADMLQILDRQARILTDPEPTRRGPTRIKETQERELA